jgi:hypothetical protein
MVEQDCSIVKQYNATKVKKQSMTNTRILVLETSNEDGYYSHYNRTKFLKYNTIPWTMRLMPIGNVNRFRINMK